MTPDYEKIIHYLNLAHANCGDSFKIESVKHSIKSIISDLNRLNTKNKNKLKQKELDKPGNKYKYPVESVKVIDELIEQEKRENL
jgi:hypothetical protein